MIATHTINRLAVRAVLLLLCWSLAFVAFAQTVDGSVANSPSGLPALSVDEVGCRLRHWTMDDGLPRDKVYAVARTPDGFLWLGTSRGLVRFDGMGFEVRLIADAPRYCRDGRVIGLFVDATGRLWVAGGNGQLGFVEKGTFNFICAGSGKKRSWPRPLMQDAVGNIWFGGLKGESSIYRFIEGVPERINLALPGSSAVFSLQGCFGGRMFGMLSGGRKPFEIICDGTEKKQSCVVEGYFGNDPLSQYFEGHDGTLGVVSPKGVFSFSGQEWLSRRPFPMGLPLEARLDWTECVEDRHGFYWLGRRRQGMCVSLPDGRLCAVRLPEAAAPLNINDLCFGEEENLWIGTNCGLYQIRRVAFQSWARSNVFVESRVAAVAEDSQGSMWFAGANGVGRLALDNTEPISISDQTNSGEFCTLAPAQDGSMWAANLACQIWSVGDETKLRGQLFENRREGEILVILESSLTDLWLGTDRGLYSWRESRFKKVRFPGAKKNARVTALAEDRSGRLHAGVHKVGVFRLDDGQWRRLTGLGFAEKRLYAGLFFDLEDNLWVASSRGLAVWQKDRWISFDGDPTLGRPFRGLVADRHDALWLTSDNGVLQVRQRSLLLSGRNRPAPMETVWYGRDDGLRSNAVNWSKSGICLASDGRIWVATTRGVSVVDPRFWSKGAQRARPPRVRIEKMLVDGVDVTELAESSARTLELPCLKVPPGERRAEIQFTALSLSNPARNQFRYCLEGFDDNWIDIGYGRSAVYHGLQPGEYRFRVMGASNLGIWNEVGAAVAVIVQPALWQTDWFKAGMTMSGIVLAGGAFLMRERYVRRRQRIQQEISRRLVLTEEQERRRISGELHDGIGQNILAANNMARLGILKPLPPDQSSQRFQMITDVLEDVIRELRTLCRALRPPELDSIGLTRSICSTLQRVETSTGLDVEYQLTDLDDLIPGGHQISLYRLIQEALHNIVRHARASQLSCVASRESESIRIQISDNGCGFDTEKVRARGKAGLGLTGMKERVCMMGGQLEINSEPGNGTRLAITIPLDPSWKGAKQTC